MFDSIYWQGPNGYINDSATINNLNPGEYYIYIEDVENCQGIDTVTIENNSAPLSIQSVVDHANCNESQNGAIDITVEEGTPGYNTCSWTGPNSFSDVTEDIDSLVPGDYTVQVEGSLGCLGSKLITVNNLNDTAIIEGIIADIFWYEIPNHTGNVGLGEFIVRCNAPTGLNIPR